MPLVLLKAVAGALCLFRAHVEGTRPGKTVLVQLRNTAESCPTSRNH